MKFEARKKGSFDTHAARVRWALAAMLCAFALLVGGTATAQQADAAAASAPNWAYQMAHDLMSPYCPGRTLSACPSPQAAELRQWILFQAAAGSTQEEVEASLFERFGDKILSAPKAEGWGLSAYVVPALGFLLGGGLVVFLLRGLVSKGSDEAPTRRAPRTTRPATRGTAAAPVGPAPSEDELAAIVDEELAAL